MDYLNNLLHSENKIAIDEFVEMIAEKVYEKIEAAKDADKLYTAKEIIAICGMSKATLERRLRDGMPYISNGNKKKRFFRLKDVEDFKTKRK